MRVSHRFGQLAVLAIAVASLVHASQAPAARAMGTERASADLQPSRSQLRLSSASKASAGVAANAVSVEDVGDIDSFARNVTWLGLAQGDVTLAASCPDPDASPDAACVTLNPAPAVTTFDLKDIASIRLPAKATHSLLCHWFSPVLDLTYGNPGATPVVARLQYSPSLTVENSVLDDPGLLDPNTGLPYGGKLLTGMTASEWFEVPLSAGMTLNARQRDSALCIAGFISKRALVDSYGLTDRQAREFFKRKTVVRLNVRGSAQYVDRATFNLGLRIVGD